jgi:tRNA (cmo5U34)-methyltransferase
LAIAQSFPRGRSLELLGIDDSAAMLDEARKKSQTLQLDHSITFRCANILDEELPRCSVVIMNYTIQFLPVRERSRLLERIFAALLPGGILIMSEKITSEHQRIQEHFSFAYERFKLLNGYSQSEIERKKEALDQVLISFSEEQYRKILAEIGFEHCETIVKWHNFTSLVALKA